MSKYRDIKTVFAEARRYRWLRDNKHLDIWWSVEGPEDRCDNIDLDIDTAIVEAREKKPLEKEIILEFGPYEGLAYINSNGGTTVSYPFIKADLDFDTKSIELHDVEREFQEKLLMWEASIKQRGENVNDYYITKPSGCTENVNNIPMVDASTIRVDSLEDYLADIPEYKEALEADLFGGREPWSVYFMRKASLAGERTTCKSREVGAVFVRNKTDIMTGYNGVPPGYPHPKTCKRKDMGCKSGERLDLCPCNHAERNAINMAAGEGIRLHGTTVYVSTKPCVSCMGDCAVVGVKEIVYFNEYNHDISQEIADHAKINLVPLRDKIIQEITQKKLETNTPTKENNQ